MSDRLRIAVCPHHGAEVREVLEGGGITDVDVVEFPPRCGRPPLSTDEVSALLAGADADAVRVFGGPCVHRAARDLELPGSQASNHCLENFIAPDEVADWVQQGAYLVSPGWAAHWRQHLEDWGFDCVTARSFFGEAVRFVLLVDTGVDPAAWQNARDFADHLRVPARRTAAGLDLFGATVTTSVESWRRGRAREGEAEARRASQDNSLYALAFSQLGRLAAVGSEAQVVQRIFDLFEMLFAARTMSWLPRVDGAVGEAIIRSRPEGGAPHSLRVVRRISAVADPLVLRIKQGEALLGVLEIDGFAHPERRDEYLNLALALRGACALAIANSRAWTALDEARQELSRRADAYRILADSGDAMLVLDGQQQVRFANPAAHRLLGARAGQSVDHDLSKPSLDVVDVDGRARVVDCRLTRIEWEGSPSRLATLRDVTDQRAAEETVRRSQKMTLLGQLAGSVAHDFNNVLQAVGGSLEMVQRGPSLDPAHRQRIDEAAEAAERGARIARRLLLFSRPSSLPDRTVDVVGEVRRMEPLLGQLAGDRVRLEVRLRAEALYVEAGEGQLEAVLLNLVTNARDAHVRRGLVLVEVSEVDHELCLAVTDQGRGIPPSAMKRIFEPFFTTKGTERGTGLGLPTVVAAVERMGGRLDLSSELGRGTRFEVRLPLVRRAEVDASPAVTPATAPTLRPGHILVVDDESTIRNVLAMALIEVGHRVLRASDGPAALELLSELDDELDLLLTDVSMPGMDGFELAREARSLRPGLRVMFISGLADVTFPGLGLDPQHVRVLAKPFRLAEAVSRVAEALAAD